MRGLSVTFASSQVIISVFPRMRGLSEQFEVSAPGRFVFPPHAGVIGRFGFCETGAGRIPPVCGGYRLRIVIRIRFRRYSPRMRGLSVAQSKGDDAGLVFPPLAGVIGA